MKRRTFLAASAISLGIIGFSGNVSAGPSTSQRQDILDNLDGDGTKDDPYQIFSIFGLQSMSEDLYGYYKLMDDIDASQTEDWYDGRGFEPIGFQTNPDISSENQPFRGVLDGNNKIIYDLYINEEEHDEDEDEDDRNYTDPSLLGRYDLGAEKDDLPGNTDGDDPTEWDYQPGDPVIKDLGLVDFTIKTGKVTGPFSSYFRAEYQGYDEDDWSWDSDEEDIDYGEKANAKIKNCFAKGNLEIDRCGGIVGFFMGHIENCFTIINGDFGSLAEIGPFAWGDIFQSSDLDNKIVNSYSVLPNHIDNRDDEDFDNTSFEKTYVHNFYDDDIDFIGSNAQNVDLGFDYWDTVEGYFPLPSGVTTSDLNVNINIRPILLDREEWVTNNRRPTHLIDTYTNEDLEVEVFDLGFGLIEKVVFYRGGEEFYTEEFSNENVFDGFVSANLFVNVDEGWGHTRVANNRGLQDRFNREQIEIELFSSSDSYKEKLWGFRPSGTKGRELRYNPDNPKVNELQGTKNKTKTGGSYVRDYTTSTRFNRWPYTSAENSGAWIYDGVDFD